MSLLDPATSTAPAARAPEFTTLTIVALVLLAVSILWAGVDTRLIDGVPVWMKPLKFALSFAVLFGTLALVEQRLSDAVRGGWAFRVTAWVMAAAFLSEMAYMMYQAARAEPSHFNYSTPFHTFMYQGVMAAGAVALVAGVAVIGWLVRRDGAARVGPGLRAGIWSGFLLTFVLTMITAGYMSALGGHFTGPHPQGAAVLPLFGWSGVTGDLRPAHFAALHAMQVLPILGWWLDRRGTAWAARALWGAAVIYAGVTFAVFAQALAGRPLIPLG
jgi:hypothetical protein